MYADISSLFDNPSGKQEFIAIFESLERSGFVIKFGCHDGSVMMYFQRGLMVE